ncbi:hypothetical protein JDW15_04735 [Aerococcaceae bacterium zg-ZJ1578]|uniref:hypothetical protein n=1 Tax=Aerococcaceae bacterium zg-252 TaxID=2796928 RepID=UPI001A20803E|nr:hypothetical protein [Aerococcaceae bacterium zg-1578]
MTKQTIVPLKHAALSSKQPMQKNQQQLKIRFQQMEITFYDSMSLETMNHLLDQDMGL